MSDTARSTVRLVPGGLYPGRLGGQRSEPRVQGTYRSIRDEVRSLLDGLQVGDALPVDGYELAAERHALAAATTGGVVREAPE